MSNTFAAVEPLLGEYADIEAQLSDASVHSDQARARQLGRRYAELGQVVSAYRAWRSATDDLDAARDMAEEDPSFAEEIPAMEHAAAEASERLRRVLIPATPMILVTSSSRSKQGRAARNLPYSLRTYSECTYATLNAKGGGPKSLAPQNPTSVATKTCKSP